MKISIREFKLTDYDFVHSLWQNASPGVGVGRSDTPEEESWRVGTKASRTADEYAMIIKDLFGFTGLEFRQIDGVILSSVVPPLLPIMSEMSRKYFKIEPLVVTSETRTGITLKYDNPREIGADRIVNAAAAFELFGGPLIIVDFGTATTFCAVTESGEYLGGAITPGVKIAAEALYQRAAKLPRVELVRPRTVIGKDTVSAMQAGDPLRLRRARRRDRRTDEERARGGREGGQDSGIPEQIGFPGCSSAPTIALDEIGRPHIVWFTQEIEDTNSVIRQASLLVESIRSANGWSEPAIAAQTAGPAIPYLTTASDGTLILIWTDADQNQ